MMGNILTYIWDNFSSLFNIFAVGQDTSKKYSLTSAKTDDEVNCNEITAQCHEKILSKVILARFRPNTSDKLAFCELQSLYVYP